MLWNHKLLQLRRAGVTSCCAKSPWTSHERGGDWSPASSVGRIIAFIPKILIAYSFIDSKFDSVVTCTWKYHSQKTVIALQRRSHNFNFLRFMQFPVIITDNNSFKQNQICAFYVLQIWFKWVGKETNSSEACALSGRQRMAQPSQRWHCGIHRYITKARRSATISAYSALSCRYVNDYVQLNYTLSLDCISLYANLQLLCLIYVSGGVLDRFW